MRREIKFRGKSLNTGKWVYGDLRQDGVRKKAYIEYEIVPETAGQYTGLKDKNGNDIYEGDILKIGDSRVAEVYWSNEEAQYIAGNDGVELSLNRAYNHDGFGGSAIEIIGNIHDNPEPKGCKE